MIVLGHPTSSQIRSYKLTPLHNTCESRILALIIKADTRPLGRKSRDASCTWHSIEYRTNILHKAKTLVGSSNKEDEVNEYTPNDFSVIIFKNH